MRARFPGGRIGRTAHLGGGLLAALFLLAVSARGLGPVPGWWPHTHRDVLPIHADGRPTLDLNPAGPHFGPGPHPFGQDMVGHDFLAVVLRGLERSLTVCFIVTGVALVIGVGIGIVAGYRGGWLDALLMRFTDVVYTLPAIVIAAVLGRYSATAADRLGLDPTLLLGVTLGLLSWMTVAKVARTQAMHLRRAGFVHAALALGAGPGHILIRHVLPNVMGPVLVAGVFVAANAVLLESGLSYLGFGVRAPDISLGTLVDVRQAALFTRPWLVLLPGGAILVIVLAIHAIGEGLAPLADARQQVRTTPAQKRS